jgi:DUF1680 family protein
MSRLPGRPGPRPGSVQPSAEARAACRPLGHDAVRLDPGSWLGAWQVLNRAATIPHCVGQLAESGSLDNLRRKTGEFDGPRRGMWFSDSDIYKTLEGIGWELESGDELRSAYDALVDLIAKAQGEDGYLHSWFGLDGHEPWSDLTNGHEMYCAGHLIQAGVAAARGGDGRLLEVARRVADLVVERFGGDDGAAGRSAEGGRAAIDGHPEIEMALVELWRQTGRRGYLELAARMIERRGHGTLGPGSFGSGYYLDQVPVRDATAATGHAVRQLYLLCGATDVAVETGDDDLLGAVQRLWDDAYGTKTYLTGGQGSRHRDEAFGDPYELPADRAYNETCAAIASVMWNWRLLLATGRRRYADELERALYNAVAVGLAADGTRFFYSNPLQLRAGHDGTQEDSPSGRLPWYRCACCPPNLARLGASLHHYVATGGGDGIQVHLYAGGRISAELEAGPVELEVATDYPWQGTVTVTVVRSGAAPWELALRHPEWSGAVAVTGAELADDGDGYLRGRRAWAAGDQVTVDFDMAVQVLAAHPAVDAARGCVALQRGPLVYCLEQRDLADGVSLDDVSIDPGDPAQAVVSADGTVSLTGLGRTGAARGWRVRPAVQAGAPAAEGADGAEGAGVRWVAAPYYRWANRGVSAMRVWVPLAPGTEKS